MLASWRGARLEVTQVLREVRSLTNVKTGRYLYFPK